MRTDTGFVRVGLLSAAAGVAALSLEGVAQERDRAQIADRYKWNLTAIFPANDAWRASKDLIQKELPKIGGFKGQLASSAAILADALDTLYTIDKELSRAYVYVGLLADQDTREAVPQGMREEMVQLGAAFSAESSYIEPEVLKIPKATLEKFIASEPRLKVHRFYLEDIAARAAHAERFRGTNPGRCRPARRRAVERLQHPVQRRLSLSDGDPQRRKGRQA